MAASAASWTRWSRLPSGALHALLVADLSEGPSPAERLILARSEAALPDALFADLFPHRGLMAVPEWREWLVSRLLETGGARQLIGPVPALLVTASEENLDALIQAGLRSEEVAFPRA